MTTNLVTVHMTTNLVTVHMTTKGKKKSLHLQSGWWVGDTEKGLEENAVNSPREITTAITEERDDHRFPPLDLTA